jgi:hypothetical protein
MEAALASIESLDEGEHFTYTNVTKFYKVDRSTLSRRYRKVQAPKAEQAINQQLLSPHQEKERVVKKEVGKGWVDRFVARNKCQLLTKWSSGMDRNRHEADSKHMYSLYFDLLEWKISEYSVLPENTYNMDEKGFMIGKIGRSKRVFSRALWESKQVKESLQDGNRE